ncbi:MAG: TetR/AcrR family transcriptional regulator [Actinobacteria bacterium]|nr:TetR/AcrR family transcriptional regulator [Actinomycetota bacterium]
MLTLKRKGTDYHHGDLKSAAVIAGRNLIAAGGLQALGIRRVAEKIGVTPAALYRHFASLEDLQCEISGYIRSEIGELMLLRREQVKKLRNPKNYEIEKFRAIGDAYVDFADSNPRLFEVAFIHHQNQSIGEYSELAWQILNESIESFVALGMTPKENLQKAPLVAWSSVHGLATLIANRSIAPSEVEFFRRTVMDGVQDALFKD